MESKALLKSKENRKKTGSYGSVSYSREGSSSISYSPLEDDELVEIRFLFRKRDAIIVGILAALIFISITSTLLVGLPKIRAKNDIGMLNGTNVVQSFPFRGTTLNAMQYPSQSDSKVFTQAAVSTNCPQCSTIAARILEQNGSAVDAAIAATICLSVADAHHTGLGGGLFMTIYDRESKKAKVIDARETAPSAAYDNLYQGNSTLASMGALSVAVPGLLKGLSTAHQLYGKLNWSQLIWPSIELCEKGFEVGIKLAEALQDTSDQIGTNFGFIWAKDKNRYAKGDLVRNPLLGQTLRVLSEKGAEEFYSGIIAKKLVEDIQYLNGILTLEDLKNYQVKIENAIDVNMKGNLRLYSVPPPASGALLAFFLNIMAGFNLSVDNLEESTLSYHRVAEAQKFMYARRKYMADPDFIDYDYQHLLSTKYAEQIRKLIKDDQTFDFDYYEDEFEDGKYAEDKGTSHVSIIASNGDSVSLTSTINQKFGARVISPLTGIVLNDEMDDFSSPNIINKFGVPPSEENFIAPGKRPVSSMCPSIIADSNGDVVFVSGAAGGIRITSATAYVILRHFWLNESVSLATDQPRIHYQFLDKNELQVEESLPDDVKHRLRKLGHKIKIVETLSSIVNSIEQSSGRLEAVGDRRGDASVYGY